MHIQRVLDPMTMTHRKTGIQTMPDAGAYSKQQKPANLFERGSIHIKTRHILKGMWLFQNRLLVLNVWEQLCSIVGVIGAKGGRIFSSAH